MTPVVDEYDAVLLDLDGTVYRGSEVVDGAVDAVRATAVRTLYVTNNASRAPHDVAEHLRRLGFALSDDDVVTSSQSATRLLTELLPGGASVLVVGTGALADEVEAAGFVTVAGAADDPGAVVQGHSPDTGWRELAEASVAIRAGAHWVVTNTDLTLPSERGLLPGNGSMVSVVRTTTGCEPVVAGKPASPIMRDSVQRCGARRPLVVGDRLDTDIAGARAAGFDSMLVFTGVSTAAELLRAVPEERPDLVAFDLGGLRLPRTEVEIGNCGPEVAGWAARCEGTTLVLDAHGSPAAGDGNKTSPPGALNALRALCAAAWDAPGFVAVEGAGDRERACLSWWGLSTESVRR